MEEKILAKLDSMQNQIMHEMNQKIDAMDQKFEKKFDKMDKRLDKVETRLDGMDERFDKIETEIDTLNQEIYEIKEDVQVALDQMFVLENDYGRKINIMYEELMARNERTEGLEKNLMALQRRVDKNSAFIFQYENQNTTLEKTKK